VRESKITVAFIVAVVVLLGVYLFVFQVRTDEMAVHYRPPGKVLRVINAQDGKEQSGLYFRLPWPIDKVKTFDKKVRVVDGKLAETQLQDNWLVVISMYAAWRLSDPVAFEESLGGSLEEAREALKEIIFNETSKTIGKYTFNSLVNTNPEKLKFSAIEEEITTGVRKAIEDKRYGMELVSFGIKRMAIPESTTKAVFGRMNAERKTKAEQYRSEGEREKKKILAEADEKAKGILADAESKAKIIRGEGEAAEAEYYDVFAQAPELAIYLRRLEALVNIAEKARESGTPITFVLDTQTEPLGILYTGPQELKGIEKGAVESGKPAADQK